MSVVHPIFNVEQAGLYYTVYCIVSKKIYIYIYIGKGFLSFDLTPGIFFIIRRGTLPYSVEDDASTTSQTPTTHYTNTSVKLTIVTHLSFSERIAIANLCFALVGAL